MITLREGLLRKINKEQRDPAITRQLIINWVNECRKLCKDHPLEEGELEVNGDVCTLKNHIKGQRGTKYMNFPAFLNHLVLKSWILQQNVNACLSLMN